MSEKFNLKWNDFQANVSKSFGLFRNESYLHDVTLVSDDFKQIPAHKLVLSATSEYFRNILQQTKQSQPLICLDGVNSEDLRNVLDYLYDGEVKIHQDELNRFLSISEKLKLEGLLGNENLTEDNNDNGTYETNTEELGEVLVKDEVSPLQKSELKKSSSGNPIKLKTTSNDRKVIAVNDLGEAISAEDHKQRLADSVQINSDETVSCKVCGRIFGGALKRAKFNAKRHVEIHIEGLVYTCSVCSKTFRSKNALNIHESRNHK